MNRVCFTVDVPPPLLLLDALLLCFPDERTSSLLSSFATACPSFASLVKATYKPMPLGSTFLKAF